MGGMGGPLNANDPTVVSAFHHALLRQGLVALVILFVVAVAWNVTRSWQLRRSGEPGDGATDTSTAAAGVPEPPARRLLRIGFGLLWLFDGLLQGQASMPLGMIPQVVQSASSSSPGWVQHLVNNAADTWSYHPVTAAAAAVWIEVGLGLWLLVAPRGDWSRVGGVAGAAWGLVVWIFGEAFGGIFGSGVTWMFGAPGAVLFYCLAGGLVALPERWWATFRLGRVVLSTMGGFFVGMMVLQAWPGRGFWEGQTDPNATAGSLTGMVRQMARTGQPHLLASVESSFAGFDASHGWAVNLFTVIALAVIGAGFFAWRRPRLLSAAVIAGVVLCLADWVLVEDLGFMGGVGTDPNSMIPMALVFVAGWVAVSRPGGLPDPAIVPISSAVTAVPFRQRLKANPTYTFRAVAALGASAVVVLGAAPMAVAATRPNADPILAEAVDGPPQAVNTPSPSFSLIDQNGRTVTSAGLRGKVVALTFLDPVCTSDCPVIAQEFRAAATLVGGDARDVELVAIDANPRYISPEYLAVFSRQENLQDVPNWRYLTGSLPQLQAVWKAFGVDVEYSPGGAMIGHSEIAFVIDATGRTRFVLSTDPGPTTGATSSSFSVTLAHTLRTVLAGP
jgi:cytochrome oxidase Cu insertion factor (SCO1/SenC/PrrC family)